MKNQLLVGLLTVGVMGTLSPLAVQAQMFGPSNQSETQTQTQTRTETFQSSQQTVQSTTGLTGAAQFTQVRTSGEVIVGADATSSIMPEMTVGLGTTTINVVNPSPKAVVFSVPALGISHEVGANSERLVQIDRSQTANLTPGQQVAYYINDTDGNQIASSNLVYNQEIASMIDTNTQVATTQTTTTETAERPQPTTRRSTVRGFW